MGAKRFLLLLLMGSSRALVCDDMQEYAQVMKSTMKAVMQHVKAEKLFGPGSPEAKAFMALMVPQKEGDSTLCKALKELGSESTETAIGLVLAYVAAETGSQTNYTADDASFFSKASHENYEVKCDSLACTAYGEVLKQTGWMVEQGEAHFSEMYKWLLTSKGGEISDAVMALMTSEMLALPFIGSSMQELLFKYDQPLLVGMLAAKASFSVWEYYHGRMTVQEMGLSVGNAGTTVLGAGIGSVVGAEGGNLIGSGAGSLIGSFFDDEDSTIGAEMGSYLGGAAGKMVGATAGFFWGAKLGSDFADALLEAYLGTNPTKEQKLKAAYEFLGVPMTATNKQVNRAYKKLAVKLHPDKAPKDEESQKQATEKMFMLNFYLEIIREARSSDDQGFFGGSKYKDEV